MIGPDHAGPALATAYIHRDSPPASIVATIADLGRGAAADSRSHPSAHGTPPLDLPLRDSLEQPRSPAQAERPILSATPASPAGRAASALGALCTRRPGSQLHRELAALVSAIALALLIAAVLGAGGATLAVMGIALATLVAATTASNDPLVRRALPPLADTLFVIIALTWGSPGDRAFAANGLAPAVIVFAGLGLIWQRGGQTWQPGTHPPPPRASELSDAGRPTP